MLNTNKMSQYFSTRGYLPKNKMEWNFKRINQWISQATRLILTNSINDDVLINPFKSQEYSQITLSGVSRRYDDDELGSGSDEINLPQL